MQRTELPVELLSGFGGEVKRQQNCFLYLMFHTALQCSLCLCNRFFSNETPSASRTAHPSALRRQSRLCCGSRTDYLRYRAQAVESRWIQTNIQHFCDHLRPAVQKVHPSIFDCQVSLLALRQSLMQEVKFAAIVQLPGDTVQREEA